MNPELVINHFERISTAPDAIAKLRGFVLDLAVRGKLVQQNPTDEPAAELMNRIAATKLKFGKSAELVRLDAIGAENVPFKIPSNWVWARLGDICSKTGSGSTPRGGKSVYQPDGVPFLRSQNVHDEGLRLDDVAYITLQTHEKMSGTAVEPADLLLNITGGSIGRCCSVPTSFGRANVSQHVAIIRTAIGGLRGYLHQLILSPYFQSFVFSEQTGAGRGGLPKNRMDRIPVALPPLPEQLRIVSRVNDLMELCNRLEAAKAERETRRDRVVAASHHYLNNGLDAGDFSTHAHFSLNHFSTITTRPEHIPALRRTILSLAIRGQLVAQDPTDEPASQLLKRIEAQKAQLAATGVIKAGKDLPVVDSGELFQLPSGWAWTRWEAIALKIGDIDHKMPETVAEGVPFVSPRDFLPNNRIDFDGAKRISCADFVRLSSKMKVAVGDLIYPRYGTIGENRLVTEERDFLVSYSCAVIKVLRGFIDAHYQYLYSLSPFCKAQASAAENKTTQANVGIKSIQEFIVPLPPLMEQRRIVAKVNQLMGLCDRLESQLTTARVETSRLLEAVLHKSLAETS